jgi:hypothetical protein
MDLHKVLIGAVALSAVMTVAVSSVNAQVGDTSDKPPSEQANQPTKLKEVEVIGNLNQAREQIVPSLGATEYTISTEQLNDQAQGVSAPFNQVILRAPGAAQDSFGQIHLRGEHANLQYRINDVLIPEGISGFGQELSTRFVDSLSLITGSLPAQYGFRTAGIVDIHTKNGAFTPGGALSFYGGTFNTFVPSFEYGGSAHGFNYFFTGSYGLNSLGIENPTSSHYAIHDNTQQPKGFGYMSFIIDDTSRINLMLSASDNHFQIPILLVCLKLLRLRACQVLIRLFSTNDKGNKTITRFWLTKNPWVNSISKPQRSAATAAFCFIPITPAISSLTGRLVGRIAESIRLASNLIRATHSMNSTRSVGELW